MRIKIALPKHHLKERLIITAIGFFCFIAALILMDEALAEEAANRAANISLAAGQLLEPAQMREGLIMLIIGLICAAGSAISTWIYIPGMEDKSKDSILARGATGFILGGFGGLGAVEYLTSHNALGLSTMALAGLVALIISVFGSLVVEALYNMVLRRVKAAETADKRAGGDDKTGK